VVIVVNRLVVDVGNGLVVDVGNGLVVDGLVVDELVVGVGPQMTPGINLRVGMGDVVPVSPMGVVEVLPGAYSQLEASLQVHSS
jgi:hypothetical protein